jgi:Ca2+-binding EF-hand superfamily protein
VTREEIATAHSQQIANAFRVNNFIVEPSEAQRKELQDKIVAEAMEMDADGDGVLSLDDILQTSKKSDKTNKRPITTYSGATLPEAFDHNGDGTISLEEFRSVVDRVLARLDSDKDGTISASEIDAFRADIDAARRARQRSIPL